MPELRTILQKNLKDARKVALLVVGSDLRGDDAAGLLIATRLADLRKRQPKTSRFRVFVGETAPENQTGPIRDFNPSHLVVVDSADAGKKPGTILAIDPAEIGGISFSTHQLPLTLMIQFLQESITCNVTVLGIQPKSLDFGAPVSRQVAKAIDTVAADLDAVLKTALRKKPLRGRSVTT